MVQYLKDGTPITTNTEDLDFYKERLSTGNSDTHIATIQEVHYLDGEDNQSGRSVEYKVRIETGDKIGRFYDRVRAISLFGGLVNFSETVYQPREKVLKDSPNQINDKGTERFYIDASNVLVTFLDGDEERPIIIGGFQHPTLEDFVAKEEDGIRHIQEFNGMRIEINDDGEYVLTYLGGKRDVDSKETERADTAPSIFKIDKDGNFIFEQREETEVYGESVGENGEIINQIKIDRSAPSITHQIGKNFFIISDEEGVESVVLLRGGSMIQIDEKSNIKCMTQKGNTLYLNNEKDEVLLAQSQGNNIGMTEDEITVSHKSGDSIITMDEDNVQITSKGSVIFQSGAMDLNMGTLNLKGSNEVNIKDGLTGALNISNGKVALGNSAAELLDIVDQLITAVSTHVHIGNLGYATAPPVDQATLAAIKVLLALIKGSL